MCKEDSFYFWGREKVGIFVWIINVTYLSKIITVIKSHNTNADIRFKKDTITLLHTLKCVISTLPTFDFYSHSFSVFWLKKHCNPWVVLIWSSKTVHSDKRTFLHVSKFSTLICIFNCQSLISCWFT